jgi:curved DNA-binding protein CbpA
LMLKWHPDRAGDTPENKTIAQLINDTYFKLKVKFK